MFVIVDYSVGNIRSLLNAFSLYCDVIVSNDKDIILSSKAIIFPGVGSFGSAIENIDKNGLRDVLNECVRQKKYFLGICLGMQIFFDWSEESFGAEGLHFLKGQCYKFDIDDSFKIPNIGWNEIDIYDKNEYSIFDGIINNNMYFCHSHIVIPQSGFCITSWSKNGESLFCSSIQKENIYGVQFHPEKSGNVGLMIIENFVNLVGMSENERKSDIL